MWGIMGSFAKHNRQFKSIIGGKKSIIFQGISVHACQVPYLYNILAVLSMHVSSLVDHAYLCMVHETSMLGALNLLTLL